MSRVYTDGLLVADLLAEGACMGHIHIRPEHPVRDFSQAKGILGEQLFWVSSFSASALFDSIGAHGTNIVISDGSSLVADVVARFQDDGLGLRWDPKPADPGALKDLATTVKDALWYVGKDTSHSSQEPISARVVETTPVRKQDYRSLQLKRSL